MKCDLNYLNQNNIPYSWNTLFVGIQLNILNNTQIADYAVEYLLAHPNETNQYITELVCLIETSTSAGQLLKHLIHNFKPETNEWNLEERKLRFCLLSTLKNNISNEEILLEKIAEIYADFNYPPDMEEFIYYMPTKNYDPSQYSIQENRQKMLLLFDNFLNKEKNDLKKSK